jgi:benzylsuccinate CoA-transferase BbsE subunit
MMGINSLNGIRVLDLTDQKGSFCLTLLAEMGANVIRIEIQNAEGRQELQQLIKNADVLVESYPVGYLASIDLDYPQLKTINPRLIVVSITPFGQNGPYKDLKTTDLVSAALGGSLCISGDPDKPPLKPFGTQTYYTAGLFAANGVLLALYHRHSSNQGQYIDISIHECAAATLDHVLVRYFSEGVAAERTGNLYWNRAFRIFPCKDGYILLSITHQWDTLVEWLDSEGMAEDLKDHKWLDEAARQKNIDHIIEILEKWTRIHCVDELVEQGQLMRFPWARVASIPQVLDNPQLNQRGFFQETTDPASGKTYKYPGLPFKSIS